MPAMPTMYLQQVVRTHQPDEIDVRKDRRQPLQGPRCLCRTQSPLHIRHANLRMPGDAPCRTEALLKPGHTIRGLQRILRGNHPPDLIQPQAFQGFARDMQVSVMGRIERSPKQPNRHSPALAKRCGLADLTHGKPVSDAPMHYGLV